MIFSQANGSRLVDSIQGKNCQPPPPAATTYGPEVFMRFLFRQKRKPAFPPGPTVHHGPGDGVLYQNYGLDGSALWYIDQGWRNALSQAEHRWAEWNHHQSADLLIRTVKHLKPSLLLLNLQTIERKPSTWVQPKILDQLLRLKKEIGFRVACRSNPSNIADLFRPSSIDFDPFRENVSSFYLQPERPTQPERLVFESGFIDVVRTAFHYSTFPIGFRNYLDLGCQILEEPHAADLIAYPPPVKTPSPNPDFDVLFVGGCWPFKWANMEPFITAMKKNFGDRFRIHGKGWPAQLSSGVLPEREFNATLQAAKVNLTLHELSQALPQPISGNERVFKLGALGCCTISDANPLIRYHFDTDQEVAYSSNPEQMVATAERLLNDAAERNNRAKAHQERVIQEHTYQVRLQRIFASRSNNASIIPFKPGIALEMGIPRSDAA